MHQPSDFDLKDFLPYLLNQAAEASSLNFRRYYKNKYGMLRTEWRVLFHLGRYGALNAKAICDRAGIHKTKVSRAVKALEDKRFLKSNIDPNDRRSEVLSLTASGQKAFKDLSNMAREFDADLMAAFTTEEKQILRQCLLAISGLPKDRHSNDGLS